MKKIINLVWVFLLSVSVFAQDSIQPSLSKLTVEQYIEKYAKLAVDEMHRSKIPASITLAQGILESGNGNSRLATEGNNHFGIKCKASWTGETIYEDDDAPNECFRKYKHAGESFQDHSEFLLRNSRYAFLFDLEPTNYVEWARGLKRAGYATNPQYAELLVTFIERHNLQKFDKEKPSSIETEQIASTKLEEQKLLGKQVMVNGVPGLVAKNGQSYAEIALDFDLKVFQIYRYNDLKKDAVCKAGDTIYIKQKKSKSESLVHIVAIGETMHWISQHYAVRLDKLLERNLLQEGQEPAVGEFIQLNETRTSAPKLLMQPIISTSPQDSVKPKSTYTETVTDNPIQNIETSKPAAITTVSGLDSLHDFKENLSFFHTVQKGETLYGIGKKYGIRVDAIQYINALESDSIEVGQKLIINPEIKTANTQEPQKVPGIHTVRAGETLYSIANIYGITLEDLMATNNLTSAQIQIGQVLVVVPNGNKKDIDTTAFFHEVQLGETLYSIARKYGKTKTELMDLNPNLSDNIAEGQKIKIR